jgi:hypothetical protein
MLDLFDYHKLLLFWAPRKIGILPPTCGYEKAAMEAAGRRKD